LLSIAQVLYPRGARAGDLIHQPGPFERPLTGETRIARLVARGTYGGVGVAEIVSEGDIADSHLRNVVPDGPDAGRPLISPSESIDLRTGDEVVMVGVCGTRLGRVEDDQIGVLEVPTHLGPERFEGCFSIQGVHGPFSELGDAGALVYRRQDLAALGLIAAGNHDLTYAARLAGPLERLKVRWN
jgi:hypothetical protein